MFFKFRFFTVYFFSAFQIHGAVICNDPTNAQVIIVNQDSSQGRHFIRDWGIDESKVVLHELWVKKCIEAGRALLHDDQWGDCIALDNGSVSDEAEVQIPQKSVVFFVWRM